MNNASYFTVDETNKKYSTNSTSASSIYANGAVFTYSRADGVFTLGTNALSANKPLCAIKVPGVSGGQMVFVRIAGNSSSATNISCTDGGTIDTEISSTTLATNSAYSGASDIFVKVNDGSNSVTLQNANQGFNLFRIALAQKLTTQIEGAGTSDASCTITPAVSSTPKVDDANLGNGYFVKGTSVTVTAPTIDGYTFSKWSDGETNVTHSAITLNADVTITAIFVPDVEKTVSTTKNWIFGGLTTGTTYKAVTAINDEYYLRGSASAPERYFTVKSSDAQTLTFADGVSVSATNCLEANGQLVNKVTTDNDVALTKDNTAGDATKTGMPAFAFNAAKAGTVYAKIKYTGSSSTSVRHRITFTDGTDIKNESKEVTSGIDEISMTSAGAGSFFIYDLSGSGKYEIYAVRFVPTDEAVKYKLSVGAVENGTITATVDGTATAEGASTEVTPGSTVTLTAVPDKGYQLNGWTDGSGTAIGTIPQSLITTVTMPTKDYSIKAAFKAQPTAATAVTADKTWKFDSFTEGIMLSGTTVYENDGLYISGHNNDNTNLATIAAGTASGDLGGTTVSATKYLKLVGGQNGALATNRTADSFTTDAIAFYAGVPGTVYALISGTPKAGETRYFNVYVNGTKSQTEITGTDITVVSQEVTTANANVFIASSGGETHIYAVRFVPAPTYGVTIASATNGTVTADTESAMAGGTVTLNVTPSDGYEVDAITVKDANGTNVTVTTVTANSQYTFTMPTKAVTVTATFKKSTDVRISTEKTWSFNDLTTGTVYKAVTLINNEYYLRANNATSVNRTLEVKAANETLTYADGKSVTVTKCLEANGKTSTAPEKESTANTTPTVGMPTLAFNTSVAGTVYAKIKGTAKDKLRVYFTDGTEIYSNEFAATGEIDEVAYTAASAGSFFITDMTNKFQLYGARFVPATVEREKISQETTWNFSDLNLSGAGSVVYTKGGLYLRGFAKNDSIGKSGTRTLTVSSRESSDPTTITLGGKDVATGKVITTAAGINAPTEAITSASAISTSVATPMLAFDVKEEGTVYAAFSPTADGTGQARIYFGDGSAAPKNVSTSTVTLEKAGTTYYVAGNATSAGTFYIGPTAAAKIYGVRFVPCYETEATLEMTDYSKDRKDFKSFKVKGLASTETTLYYILPGETAQRTYADSIKATKSGTLTYWTVSSTGGTSKRKTISVSLAPRPSLKLVSVGTDATNYTLTYTTGTTLYYTLPGSKEQTASDGTSIDVQVKQTGTIVAYAKADGVVSDTLKTTVYAPTPAIAEDGLYDFSLLKEKVGDGFTLALNSFPWGDNASVGGVTLRKPGAMTARTLDRFAFTAKDVQAKETSDWRLLTAGRLRANKSAVADTIAILDLKAGNYVTINYSGASLNYMSQSSAKLADGTTTLESQKAYEVLSDGGLLLVTPSTDKECNIFTIQISEGEPVVPTIDNVTVTLTDDKDNTKKVYTVSNFVSGQRLYFMRPQDTEWKYTGYNATYATTPYTLTATTNGYLIYYVQETATGKVSKRDTIEVNTIITRPAATLKTLGDAKSVYTLTFSKGNTVYYTVPGGTEKSVSDGNSLDINITQSGQLVAYAKMGKLTSDTLKTAVYVKTPAIAVGGKYDFSLLKDQIADYAIGTRPGEAITVGGLTLKKPDDVVENTLDRFAFTARTLEISGNTIRQRDSDWRLLSAGRLRANKTAVTDTMAILRLVEGQYLTIEYSGADLQYMSQSTAKLADSVSVLTSKQSYEILSDGDLLLRVPANLEKTCDIFVIDIAGEESVTAPTLEPRTENGEVVPNAVTLRMGTSNFGRKVTAYYTTDGSVPTENSDSLTASGRILVDESCVVKAVCISESGIRSAVAEYTITLPLAPNAPSVVYDLADMVSKGETLEFSTKGVNVYYMENNNGWEVKGRSDFMPVLNLDSMISVRAGASSIVYDEAAGTMQLKRAMAIHNLGVGDEIVILYSGSGSLINVNSERGDEYTIGGKTLEVGEEISSGAVIKITKTKYANNYIVVNASGDVYINAIYINSKAPQTVMRPRIELRSVGTETATYRINFQEGTRLYYVLESEGAERKGTTTGTYDMTIDTSDRISAWAQSGALLSDTLTAVIYAPTPPPSVDGDYDFAEPSEELPADLEVTLDEQDRVYVGGMTLYKPTAMTAQSFDNKFAFEQTNVAGKIKIRTNRHLAFNKGVDMSMALLTMRRGDIIAFDYTGTIKFADPSMVKRDEVSLARSATRAAASDTMEPGAAYIVQRDGNVLLNLELTSEAVSIAKMFVAAAPEESDETAIDFATAAEDEEYLDLGGAAMVWCHERTATVKFKRMANNSDELPINSKVSTENGYGSMTTSGFTSGNRNIAIHSLAKGDSIKVRFSGGDMLYYGHETYGNRVSVNGRLLEPGDTIHSGDVLKVELVDYMNNYVVLRLGSKAAISGIFINTEEIEKVLMPVITTKTNNTFVITGGLSTVGNEVTTVYTTNGTDPSEFNGTGGPYESFEVQVIKGRALTIKAISYTETGMCSRIVTAFYDGVNLTAIEGVEAGPGRQYNSDAIYNLHGRRVKTPLRGRVYIINGKKVIYK